MDDLDKLARRRANRKLRFFVHAGIFAVVNTTLYLATIQGAPLPAWSRWQFIGWSVGLAIHGFFAFLYGPLQERMIARERSLLDDQRR